MQLPRWTSAPAIIAFLLFTGGLYLGVAASLFSISILVGLGLFLVGIGLLGFAGLPLLFLTHARRTEGVVIAHKKYTVGEYFPIVRYTVPGRQEMTFQSRAIRRRTSLPVSTKISVLYDPRDPESAIIDRVYEKCGLFIFTSFILLIALIPLIYGIRIGTGSISSSSSLGTGIGDIDIDLGNITSLPLKVIILVIIIISAFPTFSGILKEYRKVRRQSKNSE